MTADQFPKDGHSRKVGYDDVFSITRREAIVVGVGGLTFLAPTANLAKADAEGQADAQSNQRASGTEDREFSTRADRETNRTEVRSEQTLSDYRDIQTLLGTDSRAPTCGVQKLSDTQSLATRSRDRPPTRGEAHAGEYFSDGFNGKLLTRGESPLEGALRAAKGLPEGVTVSIGKMAHGKPGLTPFSLTMVEFSKEGIGLSQTMGFGGNAGGFLSVSMADGERNWSVGVYKGSPAAVGVASISITDIFESGRVTLSTGILANAVRGEVEISYQSHPVEAARDTAFDIFANVLGPLSDYRNFQGPLDRF